MAEWGDNRFKKIREQRMIGRLLIGAKDRSEPIHVWRFVGDRKILANVRFVVIQPAKGEFQIEPMPGQEEIFSQVIGASEYINFFIPQGCLLFQCINRGNDKARIVVAFPAFMAQIERRKWLRLPMEEQKNIHLQFTKPYLKPHLTHQVFSGVPYDLSGGGISFCVSRSEVGAYVPGEKIKHVELFIEGRKIKFEGQILRIQEINQTTTGRLPRKNWKVSLAFVAIEPADQEYVARYIFEKLGDGSLAV